MEQQNTVQTALNSGVQIADAPLDGFHPIFDFGCWRTAITTGGPRQTLKAISNLSRHLETDEVFVLLKGNCTLFAAGNGEEFSDITAIPMEPCRVYNVTKGTWHARALDEGSVIFIVENRNTGTENSESRMLTKEQKRQILGYQ